MLTSYDRKKNRFRFSDHFKPGHEQWILFDEFMTSLADEHPEEFSKPLYSNNRFIVLLSSGGHCFELLVPKEFQRRISDKLKELFF